jgi:hypothetical protein
MGSDFRSYPQILVGLLVAARVIVMASHEYQIPRSYLGQTDYGRGDSRVIFEFGAVLMIRLVDIGQRIRRTRLQSSRRWF